VIEIIEQYPFEERERAFAMVLRNLQTGYLVSKRR